MDNKRKGSASPSGSGRFKWDAAPARDSFTFADDDDGPLPAPPEFDGQRGGVPDLLDAEEIVEAEAIEDPELLDSALVTELRPTHAMPPPIPAPVPTGPAQRGFLDDGEIALPPRISRLAQSFPFRKLRAEPDPDDDPIEPSTFRSAALGVDADDSEPEELDPEELEAAEAELVDDDEPSPPPPPRLASPSPPAPLPRAAASNPALRFTDDDEPAPKFVTAAAPDDAPTHPTPDEPPQRFVDDEPAYDEPAHATPDEPPQRFADDEPAYAEPPVHATSNEPLLRFADDEPAYAEPPVHATSNEPLLRFADDDDDAEPFTRGEQPPPRFADDAPAPAHQAPELRFADDDDPGLEDPALRFAGAQPNPTDDHDPGPEDPALRFAAAHSHAAEDRFAAHAPPVDDDDDDNDPTELRDRWQLRDRGAPSPAQMFADDERSADTIADGSIGGVGVGVGVGVGIGVSDDDTGLFGDVRENAPTGLFARDELRTAARRLPPTPTPSNGLPDDDDEPTGMFAVDRLREVATAAGQQPQQVNEQDALLPRAPQPSAAIAVAAFDDDDDDATWAIPVPTGTSTTTNPVSAPASPSSAPATSVRSGPTSAPAMVIPPVMASPPMVAPPPIVAATTSEASGVGGWIATRPGASMASGAISVADFADDDDWHAPTAAGTAATVEPEPTPEAPEAADAADDDDDDEWEPHAAAVNLAPPPTDLGEPFPLDLWSDPDELVGRDLGRYRLEQPLSRGMTTRVYLGRAHDDGRKVAIRVLGPNHSPAEPRARQFLYEAQQLTKLRSEHVVEVLATGTTHDHLTYYVMEYLEGETLASSLRNDGPLPWADVAAFANQICDALIIAADRGIVHNDLSASTCIRLPGGRGEGRSEGEHRRDNIKLLGVGVSPLTSVFRNADGAWTLSQGTPMGAAEFMAPEVASGGRADARTAVYAVGVLMYELATGRPPFRGDSFIAVLKKQMYEEPASPRLQVPEHEIPDVFEAVLLRALAKAPGDRFNDLRALDEALLAARAREGELRRVTQILALDPAFWDEDGSRRVKHPSAPLVSADPTPLATFAADLKQNQPELAAKVFPKPEPPRQAGRAEPSIALHLTHLAAPIVAPALPTQPAPQMPVIVLSRPPTASSGLFRNVSLAIIIASLVIVAALWLSDRNRGPAKKTPEVAESRRPSTTSKSRQRTPRDTKVRPDTPAAPVDTPTVLPPSDPDQPEPEVVQLPPAPEPEPEPVQPPPEPELKQPEPEIKQPPAPEPKPVTPPEVAVIKPVKPDPPVKPVKPVKPATPPRDPLDDRPESITSGRLQAKLASMEERVATRCRSKAGVPDTRGLKVSIRVVVDVKGEVKAKATAPWTGTPVGQCIEEMIEAIRFNETRTGGGRTHTFTF